MRKSEEQRAATVVADPIRSHPGGPHLSEHRGSEHGTGLPGPESLPVPQPRIAAIVPCHNEAACVATVVRELQDAVPGIVVYVYDNASTDETAAIATEVGAVVRHEQVPGKGNVIRRAFADVEADIYVLIDGDDTYEAAGCARLVDALRSGPFDQVTGVRRQVGESAYRRGHATGNRMFNVLVSTLFGRRVTDMLSGYRVFSRRFVKSFPATSRGFEIETELTIHSVNLRVPQAEVEVGFKDRSGDSESKLRTYHDGYRILRLILALVRHERPLLFHAVVAAVLVTISLVLGLPVIAEFAETGLVPRLPTAILASSAGLLAMLAVVTGSILDGLRRIRQETTRLFYLALPGIERP